MKNMELIRIDTDELILSDMKIADTFFTRFMGLMGRTLKRSEGLMIRPCNSVHCFFMKIPIDVLFVDENMTVLKKIDGLKPWKISTIVVKAKAVIEASEGTFADVSCGDRLGLRDTNKY